MAGTKFQATTTLAAETGNNTSAANSFITQTNGNLGAGNVSKVATRSLLYPGATAKIYAHFMPWFGGTNHMNVGYASNDSLQVQKQINDMVSRGLDGTIVDWYGPSKTFLSSEQATQFVMQQSLTHPGFSFALMYDGGALNACQSTVGCDITQTMINDLNYANTTYWTSSAYMRFGGRPVLYFFVDSSYAIDWTRVRTGVAGNPIFVFRNSVGFTHAQSDGGFSWVAPETASTTDPMALVYMDSYYKAALGHATKFSTGSGYKGFNDSLAAWNANRLINQQCGQTWLKSLAESGKYYSSTNQMLGVQIVTWNDYEEGTEIESGIDNCVTVTPAVIGTQVSWSITGQLNTIDHFSVFISQDGQNLMWLADVPAATTSLELAQFTLNSGNYVAFVKAIGKPSISNKMSAGAQVTIPNQAPKVVLNATPSSGSSPVVVTASTAGSTDVDGTIVSSTINFGDGSASINAASATHTYSVAGTYTIKANVTDNLGATSVATTSVVVLSSGNKPPIAALSVSAGTAYAPASITASTAGSSDPDGTVISSSINFGDGSATVVGPSASHRYSVPGAYTITATVKDNSGASSSTSTVVNIKAPQVIFSAPAGIAPTSTSPIHVAATGFSGNAVTTMQLYLDGVLMHQVTASTIDTFVKSSIGIHRVAVKGWDSTGASFLTAVNINVVNAPPVATLSLNAASVLVGGSITASTSGSSDADGTIAASSINFGDGSVISGSLATHQYTIPGNYTIRATVTDNLGATATTLQVINVGAQFVRITSPTSATATTPTVRVTGTAVSGYAIKATQVYVDGVLKYQTSLSTADTTVSLATGTHRITVQGLDVSGGIFKSSVNVTR